MALFTLLLVASVAASAMSAAVAPPPSLKHDTDVVRLARPSNRRMLVVDVVQPPPPTPDPVLTNEVDTSADSDLPQIVRVLVPGDVDDDYLPRATADQSADLDKISEELTELRPPAEGQQASSADWSDASPAPPAARVTDSGATPSEELLPPGQQDVFYWQRHRQPSEWMNHGFTSSTPKAEPRLDEGEKVEEEVKEEVKEPATDLQPPSQIPVGIWELFSELKKLAATAQPRAGEVVGEILEPASDLVPPPAPASDAVDYWTQPAAAVAEPKVDVGDVAEPASELLPPPPGPADFTEWTGMDAAKVQAVPEPATHLVPPARDSYMPEKPSSGEASVDDFLTLGSVPAADSNSTYEREQTDSYLPHVGEIKSLGEGPVSVESAAQAKESAEIKKDSYEKDSYLPERASSSGESVEGLTPPEDKPKTPLKDEDDSEEAKETEKHEHDHEHDEGHVTTPSAIEHEDSDEEVGDDDVDGDGVKMSISKDLRKKRHICKMCGGYGGGHGFGGSPAISIVIQKPEYGGGGGGGYCDVCGRPHHQPVHQPVYQPVYQPVQQPVYQPVQQPVYKEPIYEEPCHSCNQPPQPPPCSTCGGGGGGHGGGGSQSYSQSSSQSSSSSYSSSWGKK